MFDIGFSKIIVIFGLALVVLGPEKLPRVAATIGRWVGRARVMARQFRDQLEQESEGLRKHTDELRETADGLRRDLDPNAKPAARPMSAPSPVPMRPLGSNAPLATPDPAAPAPLAAVAPAAEPAAQPEMLAPSAPAARPEPATSPPPAAPEPHEPGT
jgi:sec-independent protein translocase protein TatB